MQPIPIYRKVPLDLSNLLKQDINNPGKIRLVTGIQAHFLQIQGVIDGKTTTRGDQNNCITKLLYERFITQCTINPPTVYINSNVNSMNTPTLSDLILNIFIDATIVQIAKISLNIHPLVTQYKIITINPINIEIMSKHLILLNRLLKSHKAQEIDILTPIIPIIVPTIFKDIDVAIGSQQAIREPITNKKLKNIMNLYPILIPNPPQDQALLQNEERVIVTVPIKIRINKPHQNGLQNFQG